MYDADDRDNAESEASGNATPNGEAAPDNGAPDNGAPDNGTSDDGAPNSEAAATQGATVYDLAQQRDPRDESVARTTASITPDGVISHDSPAEGQLPEGQYVELTIEQAEAYARRYPYLRRYFHRNEKVRDICNAVVLHEQHPEQQPNSELSTLPEGHVWVRYMCPIRLFIDHESIRNTVIEERKSDDKHFIALTREDEAKIRSTPLPCFRWSKLLVFHVAIDQLIPISDAGLIDMDDDAVVTLAQAAMLDPRHYIGVWA